MAEIPSAADERLSGQELAADTGSTLERVEELRDAGVLRPRADGLYGPGDRQRVLVANALIEAGLSVDLLRRGIEAGVVRRALEPGLQLLAVGRSMLPWLLDQHLFRSLNQMNFNSIERQLALLGIAPTAPREPSAIVFTDLAGYTRLTEERGDEAAADSATRLAVVADEIAQRRGGRLVKLLGDGVMLHFPRPADAVDAAVELREAMGPAALPPAHTGIHAGTVIRREADFFGRTVNIAARLASAAGPDEILVTDALVDAVRAGGSDLPGLVEVAPLELKGIPGPGGGVPDRALSSG